ncbi:MAG TPA: DUF692 domain-containing protein [Polyangiaceae bacterium]
MASTPALGHGVGLRPRHYSELLEHGASGIAWFEAISENFFELGGRPLAVLSRVRRDVPVVLHGVGMGLGSTHPPSADYLGRLQGLIERIEPAWISDHVCWGSADGHFTHDLLPIAFTEEMLAVLTARVLSVQDALRRPILLENITAYLRFTQDSLVESDFLNELCSRTSARLLLDLNNVFVNSQNFGFDPREFVGGIRPEFVEQIHLAGHSRLSTLLFDSHVGPVPEPVWSLYRFAVQRFGPVPSLVEWDEDVPELSVLREEAARAAAIEREVLA